MNEIGAQSLSAQKKKVDALFIFAAARKGHHHARIQHALSIYFSELAVG